ncbi:MAG: hypothetical protein LLF76_01435 [Planctomycetaceae bacterium]|nr:hypothetical protein [Planctomycetaceae bacterium]
MKPSETSMPDLIASESTEMLLLMSLLGDDRYKQLARTELRRRRCKRQYANDGIADFLSAACS